MLFYIHVPFCRARCAYCSFFSLAVGKGHAPKEYVPALVRDIGWLGSQYGANVSEAQYVVSSVFFGGGTPSLLAPDDMSNILEAINRHFPLATDAEITMEANPESLQEKTRVQAFARAGITRISMGVQSMSDADLRTLGRIHTVEQALQAAENIHAADFASFGIDLMWGLPGQSLQNWLDILRRACGLSPDHISAYGLTLEEGTRLARDLEQGKLVLPDEDTLEQMFLQGHETLEAQGFEHYEISNFARRGHR
ncbi:MAG: radical SAM family heme chaperone HemW, partial [Candidatus Desulfovibrio faecigallinarum]|nr:radical SAM family heme chaperone HemW [Candidatus Desulfovibrio faecigallinarum]